MNNKSTSSLKNIFAGVLFIAGSGLAVCATDVSQKMPWEDTNYAKDISATQADSRAEERAKGGWTEFIRHHEDRKRWVTEKTTPFSPS
jgi:hypothetical protein